MKPDTHPCGVIFLNKPKGWTSRQAVNHVIRLFSKPEQKNRKQRPKAGHAGTLDPLATGMLPILLGEATRFASLGLQAKKAYRVELDLAFQTDTLDMEGNVLARFDDVELHESQVEAVLATFRGSIMQTPPAFSAIRVDGKRAHDLARQGEQVALQPRKVHIDKLVLLGLRGSKLILEVSCSKGTYIRALARDIGQALGYGGCVTMLHRSSSGGWPEQMMVSIDELEEKKQACMIPLSVWLRDLPQVALGGQDAKRFVQGQRLAQTQPFQADTLCCVMHQDMMLGTALYDANKRVLQPERVLPSAQQAL